MEYRNKPGRIYVQGEDGTVLAEVTFPPEDGVADINHTFVDESLRGQGIAGELVRRAAEQILKDGNRIKATCPYAVKWLERHPEYISDH